MDDAERSRPLAPPGAGLPFGESLLTQAMFAGARRLMSRTVASRRFHREAQRMLAITEALPTAQAQEPVLIRRVMGIEDSSRNWSSLMTLEHLVIVDLLIISIIEHLVAGKTFPQTISTTNVKPAPNAGPEKIEQFRHATKDYAQRLSDLGDLRSPGEHSHPWFGPLDAHGWHCLAAIHHTIHRRQIERITSHLPTRMADCGTPSAD